MIDLSMFSGNQLQAAKTVLGVLRAGGITDVNAGITEINKTQSVNTQVKKTVPTKTCPQCGGGMLPLIPDLEGLKRIGCICRYSEVVE